jgi:arsenate reductase
MAEAIVNARLGEAWEAKSAGTEPAGFVHAATMQVLAELGISHQGHSKHVAGFRNEASDLVVTVCDRAAEQCPVWLGPGRHVHLAYPDPARATGSDEDVLVTFRAVRDAIARDMPELLCTWSETFLQDKEASP